MHELRKRPPHDVDDEQLDDGGPAAGVAELAAGQDIYKDTLCIGWRTSVEDIDDGRDLFGPRVTGEPMDRQAGSVTEELPQGHPRLP